MVRVEDERDAAKDIVEFLESVPYGVALFFYGRPSALDGVQRLADEEDGIFRWFGVIVQLDHLAYICPDAVVGCIGHDVDLPMLWVMKYNFWQP